MKKIFSAIFLFAVCFIACEKPVNIDIPVKPPKLVVNAWIEKDQVLVARVGKSRGILDGTPGSGSSLESYTVKNATVVVYENSTPIDTLVYQPTDYTYKSIRNKTIRSGFTYSIEVDAAGFTSAEASTTVPSANGLSDEL